MTQSFEKQKGPKHLFFTDFNMKKTQKLGQKIHYY